MRILAVDIEYDYGIRTRGINTIREYGFDKSMRELGHEVINFFYDDYKDLKQLQTDLLKKADEVNPDLIFFSLFRDQFSTETLQQLKQKYRTINWFGDDTWRFEEFTSKYAPHFSHVVTTDVYSVSKYKKLGINPILSQWAAIDLDYQPSFDTPSKYDVTFIGGANPYRKWFLAQLKNAGFKVECFGNGWSNGPVSMNEMFEIFNLSKISLNLSNSKSFDYRYLFSTPKNFLHTLVTKKSADQIKARNFEIPYYGGFQLTNYVPYLEHYFDIGNDIACFSTLNDLQLQLNYYLENPDLMAKMRAAGYHNAHKKHSYLNRLKDVFSQL